MNKSEPGPSNKCRASTQNKNVPATSTQKLKYSGFRGTAQPCSANYCRSWQRSAVNHDFSFCFFLFLENHKETEVQTQNTNRTMLCLIQKTLFTGFHYEIICFFLAWSHSRSEVGLPPHLTHFFLEVFLSVLHVLVLKGLDFFSRSTDKWTSLFIFGSLTAGASVCSAPITPGDVCFEANIFFF